MADKRKGFRGRQNASKKLVVVGIEKKRKGVSRLYARVIPRCQFAVARGLYEAPHSPHGQGDHRPVDGLRPFGQDFGNMLHIPSGKKGSNFPELHRAVMNLKGWLRGMHHHVKDLQAYLEEYCYRFNRSFMKEGIFDNLMLKMVQTQPCYIRNISN